ncbi:MAG: hypothetical protein ACYCZH_06910 [Sulfuriferula sp.]
MILVEPNNSNIKTMLKQHDKDGGNSINDSLTKLFNSLNDESNEYEVSIKVAALNQIYSTAIQYIAPVVSQICKNISDNHKTLSIAQYAETVDKIATVTWVSPTSAKQHTRCNMSFSSKYIHFLSERQLPIYDSYIWIVIIGYLNQQNKTKLSFSPPKSYQEFYSVFLGFKKDFSLTERTNYDLDKYLWQYGKNLIKEIISTESVKLDKAKSILKKRITRHST